MRRVILALLLAAAGTAALPAAAGTSVESFVQVTEKEWTLTLSRQSVRAGSVSIELVNFGMDTHDLVVQKKTMGAKPMRFKQLDPKSRSERTLKLKPGRYALWCSLPGHKQKGMHATLLVRG
jgi:plastocyanin